MATLLEPECVLATLQRNFQFCFDRMKNDTKKKHKGEARWNLALEAAADLTIEMIQAAEDLTDKMDSLEREAIAKSNQETLEERLKKIGAAVGKDKDFAETMDLNDAMDLDQAAEAELMHMGYTQEQIEEMYQEHKQMEERLHQQSLVKSGSE